MRFIFLTLLFTLSLFFTCCDEDSCGAIPLCIQPNINELTQLRVDLSRFSEEEIDDARLVRFDRFNREVIDTLVLNTVNQFEDEIIIGRNSTVTFNKMRDEINESADLDFRVLIGSPVQVFDITDIRVRIRSVECSCPDYLLESLRLDGDLIEVNNSSFRLRL